MEYLCRNMELQNNSTLIGDSEQLLQVVLKKNDGIVLNKKNLVYFSSPMIEETLYYKKKSSKDEQLKNIGKRINDNNLIRLKNNQNNFQYVGIHNGGKIMKIYPFLYNDLFIRYDCLLAFSDNIELLDVDSIRNKIEKFHKKDNLVYRDQRFYMIFPERLVEKDLEQFDFTDYPSIKDCLYLNNYSNHYLN